MAVAAAATGHDDEKPAGWEEPTAPARVAGTVEAAPEAGVTRAVGLALGLAERGTLERLAFFLENSLEERLLAWVSFGVCVCVLVSKVVSARERQRPLPWMESRWCEEESLRKSSRRPLTGPCWCRQHLFAP